LIPLSDHGAATLRIEFALDLAPRHDAHPMGL
jgi:hypothetical protein